MVSERDRVLSVIGYLKTLGLEVNWKKNKARGNKGFFMAKSDKYRIDISKDLTDKEALRVLVHEFCHYIHYQNDRTLKSLDFLHKELDDVLMEEMISITVSSIKKESVKPLFEMRAALKSDIKKIETSSMSFVQGFELYSKRKMLSRINSKISRINRYYNSTTELFARSMEEFILEKEKFNQKAPNLYILYSDFVKNSDIMLKFLKLC